MLSKETLNILRGMSDDQARKLIKDLGGEAPRCYFCGHWDIERDNEGNGVCQKCGTESCDGFESKQIITYLENRVNVIFNTAYDLLADGNKEIRKFGNELKKTVDDFQGEFLLPCPSCGEKNLIVLKDGRYCCKNCQLKGPKGRFENPIVDWNTR